MDFHADRELWDATQHMALPHDEDISYWGFSHAVERVDALQLTICRNGQRQSAFMSHEHGPMLVFFDLAHWTAYVDSHLQFDKNILHNFCFLHELRQLVEKEILGARPGCTTLLFWAARTIRGKNHFGADASELQNEAGYSHLPNRRGMKTCYVSDGQEDIYQFGRMGHSFGETASVDHKRPRNSPARR